MLAQLPNVAEASDPLIGRFRDGVRIGQTARSQTRQNGFERIRLKPDQTQVEISKVERLEFAA